MDLSHNNTQPGRTHKDEAARARVPTRKRLLKTMRKPLTVRTRQEVMAVDGWSYLLGLR